MTLHSVDADTFDQDGRAISGSGERHSGQVRIAYRLAHGHVDQLLFVHGIGWHWWDGARWAEDDSGTAQRAVLDVLAEALSESVGDKQLRADVTKCESAPGIAGVLAVASALVEFATTVKDLDANPSLLNTASGTYDLEADSLRPHDPADRLTAVTAAAYHPDADATVWTDFLASVLPDADEREYLQRLIGQALYGRVTEHIFPVLIGSGANGKSTMYGAVAAALGDYATVIDPSLLMARDKGGVPGPELMELLGARLVIGSETGEGRKLDEPAMKRLTGGDPITARRLYREPVTWTPSHQLLYVSNHLPKVRGDDPAVWRRIRVVPFDVVITDEQRDPRLAERLLRQSDAILAWAIDGYRDYREHGMQEPSTVVRATDAYRADSDAVSRFVAEACYVSSSSSATTRDLHAAWHRWAFAEGVDPLGERAFAKELDRLGYVGKKTMYGAMRSGLTPLNTDADVQL